MTLTLTITWYDRDIDNYLVRPWSEDVHLNAVMPERLHLSQYSSPIIIKQSNYFIYNII